MKRIVSFAIVFFIILFSFSGCGAPILSTTAAPTQARLISIPGKLVAENFSFEIISAELFSSVSLNSGLDFDVEAEEGKLILLLCINATNISNEVRNLGAFNTYVDDTAVLPHNILGKYGDRILMGGGVEPGKTMKAYVMYQVPMDWQFFELSYTDTLTCSRSESVKFSRLDVQESEQ